jgi:hypothetical protein
LGDSGLGQCGSHENGNDIVAHVQLLQCGQGSNFDENNRS